MPGEGRAFAEKSFARMGVFWLEESQRFGKEASEVEAATSRPKADDLPRPGQPDYAGKFTGDRAWPGEAVHERGRRQDRNRRVLGEGWGKSGRGRRGRSHRWSRGPPAVGDAKGPANMNVASLAPRSS